MAAVAVHGRALPGKACGPYVSCVLATAERWNVPAHAPKLRGHWLQPCFRASGLAAVRSCSLRDLAGQSRAGQGRAGQGREGHEAGHEAATRRGRRRQCVVRHGPCPRRPLSRRGSLAWSKRPATSARANVTAAATGTAAAVASASAPSAAASTKLPPAPAPAPAAVRTDGAHAHRAPRAPHHTTPHHTLSGQGRAGPPSFRFPRFWEKRAQSIRPFQTGTFATKVYLQVTDPG